MIRTLLYTNQPVLGRGFSSMISATPAFELLGVCATIAELLETVSAMQDGILLIDFTSEVSLAVLSDLHRAAPRCKIVLWAHAISTELALQSMGLGVRGILRKTITTDLIVKCMEKVDQGELWFEKALTDKLLSARHISLTKREGQLAALLSQGLKNKEIASLLMITEGTVKVYLSKLFAKVGVKDRFELALYALKNLTPGQGHMESPVSAARSAPSSGPPVPILRNLVIGRNQEVLHVRPAA
jgi:DNA-binding NarL/FixJ family response regulator